MSSSDIGKLTLAESWYQNASQNIGTLFNCPWFQVRLDVKFIGLCKIIEFHGALPHENQGFCIISALLASIRRRSRIVKRRYANFLNMRSAITYFSAPIV